MQNTRLSVTMFAAIPNTLDLGNIGIGGNIKPNP
jgi:hypothetical protein